MLSPALQIVSPTPNSEFIVDYEAINSFINQYTNGSKFAFVINYGLIGLGKSTFSQKISGFKHDIGDSIQTKTRGAFLSYCGTVQSIKDRFQIDINITTEPNLHVFNIDTEGILYHTNESITEFVFPLIQMSSVAILYGGSFTDLSIVPFASDIFKLTNIKILITSFNSIQIYKEGNDNIEYYLDKANSSFLKKNLESEEIEFELIPCVDFRDEARELSKNMNKYFLSRLLNLISFKTWNSSNDYVEQLQNSYSNQKRDFINAIFAKNNQSDSILKIIQNECMNLINQRLEQLDPNDISTYDHLTTEIVEYYNQKCSKIETKNEKKNQYLRDITSSIELMKINAQFTNEQKSRQQKIINEKQSKLEKEKKIVEFLSSEVANISNMSLINMLNFVQTGNSPSLKTIDSFFLAKCSEILTKTSSYVREEVIDYINKDINEISQVLKKNALSAASKIDAKEEENEKKKKEFGINLIGLAVGNILKLSGFSTLGTLVTSFFGTTAVPLTLTSKPKEDDVTVTILGHTYTTKPGELDSYVTKISSDISTKLQSLEEQLSKQIDPSIIESLPISFEPRNYSTFLAELISKNQTSE